MIKGYEASFIDGVNAALKSRLVKTRDLSEQFKNSYSEYTSNTKLVIFVLLCVGVFITSIIALMNSDLIIVWLMSFFALISTPLSVTTPQASPMLINISLICIMASLLLRICRTVVRILRTGKVDSLIKSVKEIEFYLHSTLSNLNKISSETKEFIFGDANKLILPKFDVDARIKKYTDILRAYTNPNDSNALNIAITMMHWLAFVAVGYTLLVMSGLLNIESYSLINYLYPPIFIVAGLAFQRIFAGSIVRNLHVTMLHLFSILCSLCIFILLVHLLYVNWSFLSVLIVYPMIPILLGALFTSALLFLCDINRKIISVHLLIYFVLTLIIFFLNSFISPAAHGDIGDFLLNLIATVTVLSIVGIVWKITIKEYNKVFSTAYGLLGAFFGAIEGLIVGGIIALICNIFGASSAVIFTVITLSTALVTFIGFFWNGHKVSRDLFSIPHAAWGILRGTVVFIPMLFTETGRYYPSDVGCGCIFVPPLLALSLAWRLAVLPFVIIGGSCYGFYACGNDQDFDLEW